MNAAGAAGVAHFDEQALRRAAASVRHPLTRALLVLTFTTGLIDAAAYLGLGRVFTAKELYLPLALAAVLALAILVAYVPAATRNEHTNSE